SLANPSPAPLPLVGHARASPKPGSHTPAARGRERRPRGDFPGAGDGPVKIAVALALLVAFALAALVAAVVQPVFRRGPAWRGPRADPGRLSGLVHALVALGPRNDAAGQSRAADWIRGQIVGGTPSDGVARPALQVQDGDRRVEEQRYVANGETFRHLIVRLGPET